MENTNFDKSNDMSPSSSDEYLTDLDASLGNQIAGPVLKPLYQDNWKGAIKFEDKDHDPNGAKKIKNENNNKTDSQVISMDDNSNTNTKKGS